MAGNTIHTHADGGVYALLMTDVPIKDDATGAWYPGVLYVAAADKEIRATTLSRWKERFEPSDYEGDDPRILEMLRRANPIDSGFDFIRVFESWGEREASLTSVMLDMAIEATMVKLGSDGGELTVTAEDLRTIAKDYDIDRTETPSGWTIKLTRR